MPVASSDAPAAVTRASRLTLWPATLPVGTGVSVTTVASASMVCTYDPEPAAKYPSPPYCAVIVWAPTPSEDTVTDVEPLASVPVPIKVDPS